MTANENNKPEITLFTDGAFRFGRAPSFGWLAVDQAGRKLAHGQGRCADDGTRSAAGEAAGALAALQWALAAGFKKVVLASDFASLAVHFVRPPQPTRVHLGRLFEFAQAAGDFSFVVQHVSSKHPHLESAHFLAREAC